MNWRGFAYFVLGALALANAGCLAATAGAVGAAGVGYAYYRGNVSRDFQANYEATRAAVYASLAGMGMPIVGEERIADSGSVNGLTGVGDKVHVSIETVPTPIPADGPRTRVGVRVGTFGDQILSERILHQVAVRMANGPIQGPAAPTTTWGPPSNPQNPVTPAAHTPQTAEPPLSSPPSKQ